MLEIGWLLGGGAGGTGGGGGGGGCGAGAGGVASAAAMAELHRGRARFGQHPRRACSHERVVEVRDAHRAVVARRAGRERVCAVGLALPAVARGVRRRRVDAGHHRRAGAAVVHVVLEQCCRPPTW